MVTALVLVGAGAWAVTSQSDKTDERKAAADKKGPKPTPKRTSTVGDVAWMLPPPEAGREVDDPQVSGDGTWLTSKAYVTGTAGGVTGYAPDTGKEL